MYAVEVKNLRRRFNNFKALDNITFNVVKGEFVLLLGPNGAGKTTMLRCMLGLMDFEGEVRIMGIDVKRRGKEARRHIGYLPQTISLYDDMTCYQVIDFFSDLRGVMVSLDETLAPLGLMDKAYSKVSELSGGMKQKLAFAISMLGDPEVLLLDEPFSNLDARSRYDMMGFLKMLKERGKTIIVSTHTLSGLLPIADKIILMSRGRIAKIIDSAQFTREITPLYRIHVKNNPENIQLPNIQQTFQHGWITITVNNLYESLKMLIERGVSMDRIVVEELSIDELLGKLSGENEE